MKLWKQLSGHKGTTIARYLGLSPSHISYVVNGSKGLSRPKLEKMKAIMKLEARKREYLQKADDYLTAIHVYTDDIDLEIKAVISEK